MMAMHMAGLVGIIGRPQGVNSHSKKYFESWARGRPSRLSLVKSSVKFLLSTQIQNSPPFSAWCLVRVVRAAGKLNHPV